MIEKINYDYNAIDPIIEVPNLIPDDRVEEKLQTSSMTFYILVGVLIGLVVLNLFYRFFLQKCLANRRSSRDEPQVIEVVVKSPIDNVVEKTKIMETNEQSNLEMKVKVDRSELINQNNKQNHLILNKI